MNPFISYNAYDFSEIYFQIVPGRDDHPDTIAGKLSGILARFNAGIVRMTIFGKVTGWEPMLASFRNVLPHMDFPVTWIEGNPCSPNPIDGIFIHAVSGKEIHALYENGDVTGTFFTSRDAKWCFLGGCHADPHLSPGQQTHQVLSLAEDLLRRAGMGFKETVRTWYYLDKILTWYPDFNLARTAFFTARDILRGLIPASTGIGGRNPHGSKILMDLVAIKPLREIFTPQTVNSPLQGSAGAYGSDFSRAMFYSDGTTDMMTISGTASIDVHGHTLHKDDPRKQIEQTMLVVKAILESRDFTFGDAIRVYAYCSEKAVYDMAAGILRDFLPVGFPCIISCNTVCRPDLLFEIEMDVMKR